MNEIEEVTMVIHNMPKKLKNDFGVMCKINGQSMKDTIIDFMLSYIQNGAEAYDKYKSKYQCIPDSKRKDQDTDLDLNRDYNLKR